MKKNSEFRKNKQKKIRSYNKIYIPYFFDQKPQLLFISLLALCGYYSRAAFGKPGRRLDKVGMSEMVAVVRCGQ